MSDGSRISQEIGHSIDSAIANLAARQHGNVTRPQLQPLGLSDSVISRRVAAGRLHRVHAGVYAVGRPPTTDLERAAGAVLACGEDALLSHASALALWELAPRGWPSRVEVTGPGHRRPSGLIVHRCSTLTARDRKHRQRIPVTSPARTLLDCAVRLTAKTLTRAVNDALRRHLLRRWHLQELTSRCGGHPGAARLTPFAEVDHEPTRSPLEDEFLDFCRRYGLPVPKVNVMLGDFEVDALFEAERVIVELDSFTYHSSRDAFERDRMRDLSALRNGLVTVRITRERLERRPRQEADQLHEILRRRRSAPET